MKNLRWPTRAAALTALSIASLTPQIAAALTPAPAEDKRFSFHEVSMLGTSMDLVIIAEKAEIAQKAHAAVVAEVQRLAKLLSTYEAGTELSRLNGSPVGTPVPVSAEVQEVLREYENWKGKTSGTYNAGVGVLASLWKSAEENAREPGAEELAQAVRQIQRPLWTCENGTATRLVDVPLNVDSLGKGYIVSRAAAAGMKATGVQGLLLNIGGDIAALGTSEADRQLRWSIPVTDPRRPAGKPCTEIRISDLSVATSGSYERGYGIGGKRYSHIFDTASGRPLDLAARTGRQVIAATVIAPDNAAANALATTLCLLSPDKGISLVNDMPGTGCLLVLADGSMIRSDLFRRHEVPQVEAPLDQSTIATAEGPRWPADHGVTLTWELKALAARPAERAYVAVWVEDAHGQHVTTLAVWGNNRRWLPSMKGWWRFGKADSSLVSATTRATRPAGKYEIQWDGRDQVGRQVPAGKYTLWLETCFEHGGHVLRSAPVECQDGGEPQVAVIQETNHYDGAQVVYGPLLRASQP